MFYLIIVKAAYRDRHLVYGSSLRKQFLIISLAVLLHLTYAGTAVWAQENIADTCQQIIDECPDAKIGDIRIIHRDIFETSDELPDWIPWQTVNRLHLSTTEQTIRDSFLFQIGENLDVELIRETQRKLRSLGYFRDEDLECREMAPGKVRVEVSLKENWSLIPVFSFFGRGLGTAVTVGLSEQNLLGLGKMLSVSFRKGAEEQNTIIEDAWRVSYLDPNILGSRYRLYWTIEGLESGEILTANFDKPFFSLDTPWSFGIFNSHRRRTQRLFYGGTIAADYEQQDNSSGIEFSFALTRGPPVVHRLRALYSYEQRRIRDFRMLSSNVSPVAPPPDNTYSYVGAGYRRLGVRYIRERRISKFDRDEFFNMANDFEGMIAFSSRLLGADNDEWIFSVSDSQGYSFREGHFLLATASAEGFIEGNGLRNSLFQLAYHHYLLNTPLDWGSFQHTFHGKGIFGHGVYLDSDNLFSLGYTTGLRGYPLGAITGNKMLLFSLEDRIFMKKKIFRILALGFLLFWDCGYAWQEGHDLDMADMRNAVGIGVRTSVPAMSSSNILNLTWGFPLGQGTSPLGDSVLTFTVSSSFE